MSGRRPLAIVTGGRRGIGLACVDALAAAGHDILVADVADLPGDELLETIARNNARMSYCRSDVADLGMHGFVVETALAAFGRIDCLVSNAGIGAAVRGDLLDLEPGNFDRALGVNLRGTLFLGHAVAKAMLATEADGPRSIIAITSVSAEVASPERADYCISKAGLSMWVKNLALRLAPERIAVFEVRPGIIRTDMTAGVSDRYDRLIAGGLVPAGRWGEPADVGAIVASLASGRFGFATGSVINADGALSIPRF